MTELAYIVHQIPGRVRLRIKSKRQDQTFFEELRNQLEPLECLQDVRLNCNTGSIIIRHPETSYTEVESELQRLSLFDIAEGPEPEMPALARLQSGISRIDQFLTEESAGVINLRAVVVLAAMLLVVRQVRRGELFGPALPLLWNVLNLAGRINGFVSNDDDG